MKHQFSLIVAACTLLGGTVATQAQTAPVTMYTVTDYGALGGDYGWAKAMNNSGQVLAQVYFSQDGNYHALLYSNGSVTELGNVAEDPTATGINDAGQVALSQGGHAYLYSGGNMLDIGSLGGAYTSASGINNKGQITGDSYDRNSNDHAFVYSAGHMRDIAGPRDNGSQGYAINDAGEVTGANGSDHAFLYSHGRMTDLGTLGTGRVSTGQAINAAGQVVGITDMDNTEAPPYHGFLYSHGTMADLGTLGGGFSNAEGINNAGQIVGWSYSSVGYEQPAFLLTPGIGMVDLNTRISGSSGLTLADAVAINQRGQIAGAGVDANGYAHPVLLTPINPTQDLINGLTALTAQSQASAPVQSLLLGLVQQLPGSTADFSAQQKQLAIGQANTLIAVLKRLSLRRQIAQVQADQMIQLAEGIVTILES